MSSVLEFVWFAVGSLPVIWLSRHSLVRPSSHGFYRFFAFEAILALIVLNLTRWFDQPFVVRQLVSWFLLFASIVPLVAAVRLLRRIGKPREVTAGAPEFRFENTTNLVTSGVFRYIRHPMYASLLFLAWGVMLKDVTVATIALGVAATVALIATAKIEERENVGRFGECYREYMTHSRMFVPYLL